MSDSDNGFSARVMRIMDAIPFFSHFTAEEKEQLVAIKSHFGTVEPEKAIIREGATDNAFFILLSGRAVVTREGAQEPLSMLKTGDFCGEMAFLAGLPRSASIIATEKCVVLRVDHALLQSFSAETRIKFKDRLVEKIARRLSDLTPNLRDSSPESL